MKKSQRVPGEPFRYIGPAKLRNDGYQTLHKFDAHGDGTTGIEVRTAKPEDGELINDRQNRSPLK